jgi:hypothetical protein
MFNAHLTLEVRLKGEGTTKADVTTLSDPAKKAAARL